MFCARQPRDGRVSDGTGRAGLGTRVKLPFPRDATLEHGWKSSFASEEHNQQLQHSLQILVTFASSHTLQSG